MYRRERSRQALRINPNVVGRNLSRECNEAWRERLESRKMV